MKKFLSFLLTFAMLFSLAMPAMAAEVTGGTEGEVNGTFNPEIAFTGIVIDSTEFAWIDKGDGNYIAVIAPNGTSTDFLVKYVGKNLEYVDVDNNTLLQLKTNDSFSGECELYFDEYFVENNYLQGWYDVKDGFWAEYFYSNDGGENWVKGIKVEVKQGYTITDAATDSNGTVTVPEYSVAGETVNVVVTPVDGYMLDTLTVTDASDNPVTVENNAFTMPASAVTVNATFRVAVPHDIAVSDTITGGTVTSDMDTATAGTTVTLTVTPADDYRFVALTVNDGAVEVTKVNDTTYTFVMPDEEVTVNATFEKIPHSVNVETSENGTVSADKQTAVAGDTVTLTWTAEDGYTLDKITVTNASGEEVTVDQGVLACTFVMPSSDVTVTATFKVQLVTSVAITWGSMEFTYDDTVAEGATEENGWTCEAGANNIVVENTGETTFTAQAAYASYEGYESITGSFDPASKELAIGEKYTFTLELSGKPTKVLSGDKIGKVTITINEAAEG